MKRTTLFRAVTLLAIATAIMPIATAGFARPDTIVPVVFSISPTPVTPGAKVTMDVGLSQTPTTDQVVTISSGTSGNWDWLPSQVVVHAGSSHAVFAGYVSDSASGTIDARASCNGMSVVTCTAIVGR